ncbi:hypothetical protein HPP92_024916 [Vanilla planifolia]|uniref:Uncharacterized protein n=1 Tax=Vanilla planifolia TaxID=51239 RepID=A0A835PPY9_VANPL|nr:hypothetical protein HPP92_024916 [Vanilla planifolia]
MIQQQGSQHLSPKVSPWVHNVQVDHSLEIAEPSIATSEDQCMEIMDFTSNARLVSASNNQFQEYETLMQWEFSHASKIPAMVRYRLKGL